jgi:Arc/MetJ-type ribon-helix-helix transcriptional regulator
MTMNIALTDDLQRLLRERVENGQFPSEEAVIKEALERFFTNEPVTGRAARSLEAQTPSERTPGPFIEDEMTMPPVELPRTGREIACICIGDAARQPDLFPGE